MPAAYRAIVGALLAAFALTGCGDVAELPGRAYGALVGHFNDYAAARSPVMEQQPVEVHRVRARPAPQRVAVPVRIEIPTIAVDSRLDRVGREDGGTVAAPSDWETPAWYRRGVRPGQPGPAVVLGHVDSKTGPAVFHRLDELTAGDEIRITRRDGSVVRFEVRRSARFPKTRFPTSEVYLPTPDPTLRLITCGGTFDRAARSYRQNLVVFAELVEGAGEHK
jgi:sortase (surface protein transpeptidase)